MGTPEAAVVRGTVLKIRSLQATAVFVSWGWWPTAWRRIEARAEGLRRGEFRFDIAAADVADALRVDIGCRNGFKVEVPDMGRYFWAVREFKRMVDETEAEIGRWQTMTHEEEQADER